MEDETARTTPTPEDIETALNKTGFLLEHRVAQSLRKRQSFYVNIAHAYPDPESGKSREIDVLAAVDHDVTREPDVKIMINAELIIECKNSSGPFVLIGDHGEDFPWLNESVALSFDPLQLNFPKAADATVESNLKLDRVPGMATVDEFTGYQLLRLNRQNSVWKADNNAVYDSILYPLAKAWQHQLKLNEEELQEEIKESETGDWKYPSLTYMFPIIVTSGQIFVVDVTSGQPEINEAKWAKIKRTFKSKELSCDLRADVVSFQHWEEYLDARIVKVVKSAHDVLAKNTHFFDPEWLSANLGEPEYSEYFHEWLNHVRKERDRR